jgi:hypothetical protein
MGGSRLACEKDSNFQHRMEAGFDADTAQVFIHRVDGDPQVASDGRPLLSQDHSSDNFFFSLG